MQNNEFEKEVQERMGQIKFTPSEAVWIEVAKSLKHRRKRRVAIIWLFVFFIAAGGSSLTWFYFSPGNNGIANHDSSSAKKDGTGIPAIVNKTDEAITLSPNKKENPETPDVKKTSPSKNIADIESKATGPVAGTPSTTSQKNTATGAMQPKKKNKNLSPGSSLNVETPGSTGMKSKEKNSSTAMVNAVGPIAVTKSGNKINANSTDPNEAIDAKENALTPDSATTQKEIVVTPAKTIAVDSASASPSTAKITTKTKSKWLFGVNIGVGMSDVVNPVLGGAKSMDAAYASPPSSNLSAPGSSALSPGLPASGVIIYPSELNPGISFSIGAEATRKIKKRMSLNVGLQYHYYSTSIVVGHQDSAVNSNRSFSAFGPRVNNHRNKYHFAELPVTMGFQLLKNKPLQLNAGLSVGYLFASDVLFYNNSRGIYNSDKDQLNKTQLNVLLGLSWTFAQKSKMPIQVGPNISYGASNLSSKSANGSNHMFYFGGGAKVMFRKK